MSDRDSSRAVLSGVVADPTAHLDSDDPAIRRIAVAACVGEKSPWGRLVRMLTDDPEPAVRRECAEVLGLARFDDPGPLLAALDDEVSEVREAAVTALGETAPPEALRPLLSIAENESEETLVREAAVAALGALGDRIAVPTLLRLLASAPPQVRRRCIAALSVFDGDEVEQALRRAAADRNPMVREAAEMVVGRTVD